MGAWVDPLSASCIDVVVVMLVGRLDTGPCLYVYFLFIYLFIYLSGLNRFFFFFRA
jgi:hypothetical protein